MTPKDEGLTPLLMPSGPQWSEKWIDRQPPHLIRYDHYRYAVEWRDAVSDRHAAWPTGAWVCVRDRGALAGRLWWKQLVPAYCRVLWALRARKSARRLADHAAAYPFGGVPMRWRFAIGPDLKPWVSGDPQPQDGSWPISIAVFSDYVPTQER